MKPTGQNTSRRDDAFTLTELLVVIATLAILAALLAPALASTKPNSRANQCLENQRRIMLAWRMYAEDNNDLLPPNDYPAAASFVSASNKDRMRNWVAGTMTSPLDATLTSPLTAPQTVLYSYLQNPGFFKCPADASLSQGKPKTRSYSMSNAVGTRWWNTPAGGGSNLGAVGSPVGGGWLSGTFSDPDPNYRTFGKLSQMSDPGPANTWVIIDENPQTINDGLFAVAIPLNNNPANAILIDIPAGTHDRAAGIAFADGHSEIHRWQDTRTYSGSVSVSPSPYNLDVVWLAAHTTVHR